MTALGFIETEGLLAAVEAADTMVKAADVRLVEKNIVGDGLVTITVSGEVSAVQTAVEAGKAAVCRLDKSALVADNVIARAYEEVARIVAVERPVAPIPAAAPQHEAAPETTAQTEIEEVDTPEIKQPKRYKISELKKTEISMLRQMAFEMSELSLTTEEIKAATKMKLIEAILKATNR
ncbi:BMC domain-containing protein [Desulfosediminicola sp.]|uniref:BMC domain-containing protein n=1 Tax=Desulfosediminicola sp. TaxID=2886825 RepID=UPI003AF2FB31